MSHPDIFYANIASLIECRLDICLQMSPRLYAFHPSDISFITESLSMNEPNNEAPENYLDYFQESHT